MILRMQQHGTKRNDRDWVGSSGTTMLQCMKRAIEEPEPYPLLYRNTRRALSRRFPFGVFYRVEESIVVVAVMHASRDPQRWTQRA